MPLPKLVVRFFLMNPSNKCAMQYAAMEFIPITMRKKDQERSFQISMIAKKAAVNRKHQPPLNNVQLGVQMRLTTGQMPRTPSNAPETRPMTPAAASHFTFDQEGRSDRSTPPAIR